MGDTGDVAHGDVGLDQGVGGGAEHDLGRYGDGADVVHGRPPAPAQGEHRGKREQVPVLLPEALRGGRFSLSLRVLPRNEGCLVASPLLSTNAVPLLDGKRFEAKVFFPSEQIVAKPQVNAVMRFSVSRLSASAAAKYRSIGVLPLRL